MLVVGEQLLQLVVGPRLGIVHCLLRLYDFVRLNQNIRLLLLRRDARPGRLNFGLNLLLLAGRYFHGLRLRRSRRCVNRLLVAEVVGCILEHELICLGQQHERVNAFKQFKFCVFEAGLHIVAAEGSSDCFFIAVQSIRSQKLQLRRILVVYQVVQTHHLRICHEWLEQRLRQASVGFGLQSPLSNRLNGHCRELRCRLLLVLGTVEQGVSV